MKFELLLVDDDEMVHFFVTRYIKKAGLTENPRSFINGKEAFEYIAAHSDNEMNFIVLLDINMPVMNGWGFLEAINSPGISGRVSVVILTSSVDFEDSDKAKNYPMVVSYLIKPVDADMLAPLKKVPELVKYYG